MRIEHLLDELTKMDIITQDTAKFTLEKVEAINDKLERLVQLEHLAENVALMELAPGDDLTKAMNEIPAEIRDLYHEVFKG